MFIVATFVGPDARASKNRTPGRIATPVPRGGNAGGPAGSVATIEAAAGWGTAGSPGWFARCPPFNRMTTRSSKMPITTADHMKPFAGRVLLFDVAVCFLFFGLFAATSVGGTAMRGGSIGAGSASP